MKKLIFASILVLLTLHITAQNDILVPFKENGKYGFKDPFGEIIIPALYDGALNFSEGLAPVKKGKKWGYIDTAGEEVISFIYDNAFPFSEGLARVKKIRYGYIDRTGELKIKHAYIEATDFKNGTAVVTQRKGEIGSFGFAGGAFFIFPFHNQAGIAGHNETWIGPEVISYKVQGLIDAEGKVLIPLNYRSLEKLTDNLYKVKHPYYTRFGVFDIAEGKLIIPLKFGSILLLPVTSAEAESQGSPPEGIFEARIGKKKITYFDIHGAELKNYQ